MPNKENENLKDKDDSPSAVDCYVVTLECSTGNESVGHMWLEHKICNPETTLKEIMEWKDNKSGGHGRLIVAKAT